MQDIADIQQIDKMTWFNKRCRDVVLNVLAKIEGDLLDVIEGSSTIQLGSRTDPAQGAEPLHAQIIIKDPTTYIDFVKGGSIGAAEAFIANKWTSPDLTVLIRLFARAQSTTDTLDQKMPWLNKVKNWLFHAGNKNTETGSKKNILAHYDLGNELYTRFLDPEMMYSSAIYPNNNSTLAEAQLHKLKRICDQLELSADDHLLEIGTGWGGLAIFAAQHYGCKVTTTTISDAQFAYAQERVKEKGLEQQITLLKKDYRELEGQFDKVVSVEMIEAVGYEFMSSFFKQCNDRLKPGGKLLIQAITIADQRFDYYLRNVDFIQRYIFPGGFLPSITFMCEQLRDNSQLVVERIDDIGLDYARTLADWREAFLASWSELTQFGYDEKFKRLWLYYLGYCEGAFLERSTSTVHLLARK
ncbi:class I SAM-dependent methyltransferase [Thalassotalea aquiviva]|uniref:class I SAM-dependent methyltransferase n=1 Tax=Thalassotalea aquiviva TaxID=3242415 RepID=UPI00352AB5E3